MTDGDRVICKARPVFLFVLILLSILHIADSQVSRKSHIRMQKLCSRSLSDALYLVCRERGGYNEPFSYSGEDEPRVDPGPGLVEECCYHSCSYYQLERYCKPPAEERHDVIGESYMGSVVNLPFSMTSSEQRSGTEHVGTKKRKVDDLKRERHRGKGGRNIDDECKGKPDVKKRHRSRHCRCRRRRLECRRAGKVSHREAKHLDNQFMTSSPTNKPTSSPTIS